MYPKRITSEYLRSKLIVLKDNFIYRISDSNNSSVTHKINKEILQNKKYDGTILKNTLLKRKEKDQNKKMILQKCIQDYATKNKVITYNNNYLVIHLRTGDIIGRLKPTLPALLKEINNTIEKNKNIQKIVIVTAMHYGQPSKKNSFDNSGQYSYSDKLHEENISTLTDFFKELPLPIIIESSQDIDKDACKLMCSKNVIFTTGGFSKLMKELHEKHNTNASKENT